MSSLPKMLIFLNDMKGFVQVYGRGGLAIGETRKVLDLVREAFSAEEEVVGYICLNIICFRNFIKVKMTKSIRVSIMTLLWK